MHPLLRFTLDLFDINQPVTPVNQAQVATKKVATKTPPLVRPKSRTIEPVLTAPLLGQVDPANFRHPKANREVCLGDALVAYEFKRGLRRSIGFSVGPRGLAVRAPKWTPLHEVDSALQTKAPWILRKLHEARERHAKLAAQVTDWRDGVSFPFLGQDLLIRLDPEHRFGAAVAEMVPSEQPPTLRLSLSHGASADQIRTAVQAWLMRQAKQVFQTRLENFAPLLGVHWKKLGLSNAGTRWGSAKSDGSIRLNWRLIHFSLPVLDYVVVHELSHLREMNHSPRFWEIVRSVLPDYAVLRQQLKDNGGPHSGGNA